MKEQLKEIIGDLWFISFMVIIFPFMLVISIVSAITGKKLIDEDWP